MAMTIEVIVAPCTTAHMAWLPMCRTTCRYRPRPPNTGIHTSALTTKAGQNCADKEEKIGIEDIERLESRLDFEFPEEYKQHLLKHNGGRCEPNLFFFSEDGKKSSSDVDWFLALYDGEFDNLETFFRDYKIDEKRMPVNIFPIASDSGGNAICMDKENCSIYFWDHEKEVDYNISPDEDWSNLYFISDSLKDFIDSLTSSQEA